MTKEQQDLAWACLPKEVRDEIKRAYEYQCQNREYNRGFNEALEEVFSSYNLTSDTEPEEMLMVEKKKVQEVFVEAENSIPPDAKYNVQGALHILFGDKCLPDKENLSETKENMEEKDFGKEDNFTTKELEHGLEQTAQVSVQVSVQVEPKFPIGSIVRITNKKNPYHGHKGKFGKVITYDAKFNRYAIAGIPSEWEEGDLEPYTEPETKDDMKTNFVRRSDEPDNNFGGVESAASTLNIKDPEDLIETLDFLAERDAEICNEVNPAEEKAVQRAWCEYSNMEGVEGYVPLLLGNFEKAYELGRRDALAGQWRSVIDGLPEPEQDVFVAVKAGDDYTYGYAWLSTLSNGTLRWYSHDDCLHLDNIKFWMPIPQLLRTKRNYPKNQ